MADWYVSSAAYSGYTAFQASHLYTIGDLIVPTAPTAKNKYVFRCTTGGTSSTEPSWASANSDNSTITSGGATFTNVTGRSTYFWTAAAGDLLTLNGAVSTNRIAAGDRCFISSDHSESNAGSVTYGSGGAGASFAVAQFLCVNRAGSTPPVAADLTTGATVTVTTSGSLAFEAAFPCYHYGISYIYTGTSTLSIYFNSGGLKGHYFDNCLLYLNTSTANCRITTNNPALLVLNNTPLRFGATSHAVACGYSFEMIWQNTPSALAGAIFPTTLFLIANAVTIYATLRGVDLSALTGTLFANNNSGAAQAGCKFLLDSCKIASGLTRSSTSNVANDHDEVELVNCYDGTNILSERYQPAGSLVTETTITLSSGATDDVGAFSHKMVSTANLDKFANTMKSFWMDVENTVTGTSKTATVEIISSASLNNDEISLELQYEGTAGSSLGSFGNSFIATPLTTPAAVTSSSATWNSSPSTPVTQHLQVAFTAQHAGRVRGRVRLGKPSTTVYVNPQITIS